MQVTMLMMHVHTETRFIPASHISVSLPDASEHHPPKLLRPQPPMVSSYQSHQHIQTQYIHLVNMLKMLLASWM